MADQRQIDTAATRDALIVAVLRLLADRNSPRHHDAETEAAYMKYIDNAVDDAARHHVATLTMAYGGEPS